MSEERDTEPTSIMQNWTMVKIVPAVRSFPFVTRYMARAADMHDVPLVRNDLKYPRFRALIKKRKNIRRKNKSDIVNSRRALDFVKISCSLYFEKKVLLMLSEIDIFASGTYFFYL